MSKRHAPIPYVWNDERNRPSPKRHSGPLKDLLIGVLIGAGIMVACFLLGYAQVMWW